MDGADDDAGGRCRRGEASEEASRLDLVSVLESIPEPVGLVDRSRRVIAFNAAGRAVVKLSPSGEIGIGTDFLSFAAAPHEATVRELVDRALAGETCTHRTETKGRVLETVYSPVRDADGEVRAASVRVADVTARERALAELAALNAELEQRVARRGEELRAILSAAQDGFALVGGDDLIIDLNEPLCRLLGYGREELLGMHVHEVGTDLTPEASEALQRTLRTTGTVSFETRARRKDGTAVELGVTATWEEVEGGRYFAFARDLTARKEAEELLVRQLEILEATPDLVGMSDDERRIVYLNPAGRRLLGVDDVTGRRLTEFLAPSFLRRLESEVGPTARAGEVWQGEGALLAEDGREVPVLQVVVPHLRRDGSLPFFSTVAHDVTELKRTQRELEARSRQLTLSNAELERALSARDAFLANMSHELRTPLTGILGAAELLRGGAQGSLSEGQKRTLAFVEDAGRHLLGLVSDVLDLAKVGAGTLRVQTDPCGLAESCESALAIVREAAARKGLSIGCRGPGPGVRFVADGQRVRQILVNLLSNAVKFTPEGGSVELAAEADEEAGVVRFSVRDDGPGIAPEDVPRLFLPFVQLDTRLSRENPGTGLGLPLVRSLAELHGGSVEVESAPGKGSLFTVTLPWRRSLPGRPMAARPEPVLAVSPGDGGAKRVLLVEDDDANRTILVEFLGSRGFAVDEATNGPEALERAAAGQPDLVVLDVQLPGMDGLEVLARLRASGGRKPAVLAFTAFAMAADRERLLSAGADAYLAKPAPLGVLEREIRRLLEERDREP